MMRLFTENLLSGGGTDGNSSSKEQLRLKPLLCLQRTASLPPLQTYREQGDRARTVGLISMQTQKIMTLSTA